MARTASTLNIAVSQRKGAKSLGRKAIALLSHRTIAVFQRKGARSQSRHEAKGTKRAGNPLHNSPRSNRGAGILACSPSTFLRIKRVTNPADHSRRLSLAPPQSPPAMGAMTRSKSMASWALVMWLRVFVYETVRWPRNVMPLRVALCDSVPLWFNCDGAMDPWNLRNPRQQTRRFDALRPLRPRFRRPRSRRHPRSGSEGASR